MKKILTIVSLIFVFAACGELESLNKNTKDFTVVPGESLFNGAMRSLTGQLLTCNVNSNNTELFVQQWTETTYTNESRYDMVTRPVPENHMNLMYKNVLMNLKEAKRVLTTQTIPAVTDAVRANQLAIVDIAIVYAMSNVVETYGNMPYTEAWDFNKPTPVYDDGLTIYKDLLTRLDADIAAITTGASLGTFDNFYGGNVANWKKFANTLKMRMGLTLADMTAEAALAKSTVESAAAGAFSVAQTSGTTGDKFALAYQAAAPNQHPLYTELVVSGRYDFVPANTLVNKMNALSDPRRALYFTLTSATAPSPNIYLGGIYGQSNAYTTYSHVNPTLVTAAREGLLMDYVEAEFMRAEAIERGYTVAGTAEQHYNNAITASILYWGGTAADAATYLARPDVAYTTAAGNWKEKIGTQAWIAYWFRGMTAWQTWRRLDYPRLVATPAHVTEVNGIPLRYTFAVTEQTLNGANYTAAAAAIGGDNAMTPLFWDKFQYNTLTGL